jgi:hypothetical protein
VSRFSAARRREIVRRAGGRCEYCRLSQEGQVATFPIDHIVPVSKDGGNELDNLALACPRCNALKWAASDALDPLTGEIWALFHPRRDAWVEHFHWSATIPGILVGTTPSARATIEALQINATSMVQLRKALFKIGLFRYD